MGMTDTATRLIKRFGQTATLTKPGEQTGPSYDPTFGPDVEHTVTVAVTNFTADERSGELIAESDLRVFMTASVEPTTADALTIGGEAHAIETIHTLGPDGVVICYELRVRS